MQLLQEKIDKYKTVRSFIQSCIVSDAKPEHNFIFKCRLDDCNQFIADLEQIKTEINKPHTQY